MLSRSFFDSPEIFARKTAHTIISFSEFRFWLPARFLRSLIKVIKRFLIWANICERFDFWICLKEKSIIFGENSKSRQNMKRNHDKVNHVKQNSNRLTSSTIVIGHPFIRTRFASWTPDCETVKYDLTTGRSSSIAMLKFG